MEIDNSKIFTYIASTYGYIRSSIFKNNNRKNRRLKRDLLSVSEANQANVSVSEANTLVREIIDEIINNALSEANVSVSEANQANIYEIDIKMNNSCMTESYMTESWCTEYNIDSVKIYHCHIPILSNESDDDDDF
jgi:hypothetical protein